MQACRLVQTSDKGKEKILRDLLSHKMLFAVKQSVLRRLAGNTAFSKAEEIKLFSGKGKI